MTPRLILFASLLSAVLFNSAHGQQPVSLINAREAGGGWNFGNGPEFPGAKGKLEIDAQLYRDQPVLRLEGDFTAGGNYVQAATPLPETPVDTVSFWINVPAGASSLPIRLVDGTSQCHQIRLKLNDKGGWQKIVLPVEEYFQKMGTAAALDIAAQYEKWGGANDGRWHQPGKLLVALLPKTLGAESTLLFSDVQLIPSPPKTDVAKTIPLDELLQAGETDWSFNLGQEFPGAKGGLEVAADQPSEGKFAMRLHADFTEGGAYVGTRRSLEGLDVRETSALRMTVRSEATEQFALRLVDATGQCHQRKTIAVTADGKWHEIEILPTKIAGGEHWGGANDGKWHGPLRAVELMLNTRSSETNKPELLITDIRADVVVEARAAPASFRENFDSKPELPEGWTAQGDVAIAAPGAGDSKASLVLKRTLEKLSTATQVASAPLAVDAGSWQVQYAWKSDLHSPDNSYHAALSLQALDPAGKVLETLPIGIGFGKQDWRQASQAVSIPEGATRARLVAQLNKTYGEFRLDDLSVSRLSLQPIEQRVARILLSTDVVGNLFLPGQEVVFHATVEAIKPLAPSEQVLHYSLRDYWGAEQIAPGEVSLSRGERKDGRFQYTAEIALPAEKLAVGKFMELHASVPQQLGEPAAEFSGLAILPEAPTRQYEPEQVPFTIRNWDSRIPAYFRLSDRLGLRMLGVWGGWKSNPPYNPHLPTLELCRELGAKWVTGTPASSVERNGFKEYSEEALRQGMKNFLEEYADEGLAMIATGNEPHGTGQKVLDNVRAYRAIYETVKEFDPAIHVIGTSVEPNEEYFQAGYQNYLDAYDFHIYEHYTKVRRQMGEYRKLMKKYDAVKPIHSTELGLNSQGQTRLAAARELIKKCTVFFAEGGATVSWFTIQYPDPQGKARGQFGDSHCVFDCKYNLYNPRLDAVTYYHMINGVAVKKFLDERHYADGVQAYLFRDDQGRCLQVLWLDDARKDVLVPLADGMEVRVTSIDGSQRALEAARGGVTVTVSEDPVMLLYKDGDAKLPEELGAATTSLINAPLPVAVGGETTFTLSGEGLTVEALTIESPPQWTTKAVQSAEGEVRVAIQSPRNTPARQARLSIVQQAAGKPVGAIAVAVEVAD
ncbi:MAG: hypothetical protein RIC55_04000 [Pirellulaceae bacterium]